jgi:hypothetical protein
METLSLSLGDVVSVESEERWLAGALVAKDRAETIGALFYAPEGAKLEVVAAFPAPRREIFWLSRVELDTGAEPPTSVELEGVLLQRKRRLPVALERVGQSPPDAGSTGIWAEYAASGGARAVVLRTGAGTFAYAGKGVDDGFYDRMGKGS